MTRTPVKPVDLAAAVATALNGTLVQGGTLSAVANGTSEVKVKVHSDQTGTRAWTDFTIRIH